MRLHSLELTAFGSFGGTEHVDFDRLSESGLFLLYGPTGAGKTTILDAVSYALFGKVPGVRNEGVGLRSHHAAGSTPTEVRLDVTLRSRRYRIMRQPRQLLPKRRGVGVREQAAKATVEELVEGEWLARAAKPAEADPLLQEQLHMAAEQFHQIVMLPQGDFAKFLQATPEARRGVLEELFSTQRFADVEQWLKAQADTAEEGIRAATEQIRRTLVATATIAGVDPFPDDEPVTGVLEWLSDLRGAARERADATGAVAHAARRAHDAAQARRASALELHDRQVRHARASAERVLLAEAEPAHEARVLSLTNARRALPVLPLLELATRADAEVAAAQAMLDAARGRLVIVAPAIAALDAARLAAHDEELVAHCGTIDALVADEEQMVVREHAVVTLQTRISEAEARLEAVAARRRSLPDERISRQRSLQAARDAATRLDPLQADADRLEAQRAAAVERDRLVEELRAAGAGASELRSAEQDAYARYLDRREAQLRTRAAALAAELEAGEPCPVCGNRSHPAPATVGEEIVTDEAVDAAHAARESAKRAFDLATTAVAKLEADLAGAKATARGARVARLAVECEAIELALGEAREGARRLNGLEREHDELEVTARALDSEAEALGQALAADREQRGVLDTGVAEARRRVLAARASFATLADRRRALRAERDAVTAVVTALHAAKVAERACVSAHDAAASAAIDRGFPDLAAARAAAVDDATIVALEEAIRGHDKLVAEVTGELHRSELVTAAAQPAVDLAAHEAAAADSERAWNEASTRAASARTTLDAFETKFAEASTRLDALAPLERDHERKRHLATLALGEDRQVENRMRLSTYVLAARLEQVAAAASERLRRISGGRYTIVHTDAEDDARRKGGLGLRVVDAWTSTERETNSLSGGESFFTSLALALGVADVVTAEIGGIQIDTMFVDEGFGSLDDETLHDVMDVLDGLRAGGRCVGIVSHVADLRSRITTQVEVLRQGTTGSTIRVAGA